MEPQTFPWALGFRSSSPLDHIWPSCPVPHLVHPPPFLTQAPSMPWGPGLSPLPLVDHPRVTLWLPGCASTGAYGDRSSCPSQDWASVCFKGHAKGRSPPSRAPWCPRRIELGPPPGCLTYSQGGWHRCEGAQTVLTPWVLCTDTSCHPVQGSQSFSPIARGERGAQEELGVRGPWPQLWELRLGTPFSSFHCPGLGRWRWVHRALPAAGGGVLSDGPLLRSGY